MENSSNFHSLSIEFSTTTNSKLSRVKLSVEKFISNRLSRRLVVDAKESLSREILSE